jgi:hypothetical protein
MTKGKELTDYQKNQIEGRVKSNTHTEISEELDIPRRTISNFLTRLKLRENKENLPHPGRPRKTSHSDDRYLVHAADADTDQTLKDLRNSTNIGISVQTIRRRLREAGIRKWRAKRRPLLNEKQAAQRYQWAKDHRHFARNDFRFCIVFGRVVNKEKQQ